MEFVRKLKIPPESPRSTAQKGGEVGEMSREETETYNAGQLLTITSQRDNVRKVAQAASCPGNTPPGSLHLDHTAVSPSWVSTAAKGCRYVCCQQCRPRYEEKSYLSLDGIVNGDIPATAAIGFGFHRYSCRPIIHPDRVRNIGLRAVPWSLAYSNGSSSEGSCQSAWDRSRESVSTAEGQEDQINHVEHAEHVEHVEHVEYFGRNHSLQSISREPEVCRISKT
ncbi:uncharacterized protein F4812DRAFT_447297 [Daldinia caldariorum]|uniref:uncharacterized protein n=1 Tax=Daldinia caldariorum TaxID=326644 RepID=UPI002008C039|nr:uncharacterized protein F4812DRAFT_447297 [Daldinia caldariorum]KAI1463311.1 hypothetical protein F4812DRAFT_447297 [Daldinia caldariorum]